MIDRHRFVVAALAGVALMACAPSGLVGPYTSGGLRVGDASPEVQLINRNAQPVRLSSLHGRVTVLNFWAAWCGPCRAEMPELERLYQTYQKQGLKVLGLNVGETSNTVQNYLVRTPVSYEILLDGKNSGTYVLEDLGRVLANWQNRDGSYTIPYTVVLDVNGMVRAIIGGYGGERDKRIEEAVRPLLGL